MLRHLCLFSGIGGFSRAAQLIGGIKTIQFVEVDPDAQSVLRSEFEGIPIHSDIRDFTTRDTVEIITAGFPCTGTSVAGSRTGLKHEDSGLWYEAIRVIRECRPKFVVIENPTGLLDRGMGEVIKGLSEIGYMGEWETISGSELGAPHKRERVFIIAYLNGGSLNQKQPTPWADQMRDLVQEQRAITRFPMLESSDHGIAVRFPKGLDEVPIGIARGAKGRIRSRYLYGRTVIPAQAAIALRRVKYLNSL